MFGVGKRLPTLQALPQVRILQNPYILGIRLISGLSGLYEYVARESILLVVPFWVGV